MTATAGRTLRMSALRDCPRKAVLAATSMPDREFTDREARIMYRGRNLGREFVVMLAHGAGGRIFVASGEDYWVPPTMRAADRSEAAFVAEQPISWDFGIGHADVIARETRSVIEVLSSAHASETMIRSKLLQAVGYRENYPEASGPLAVAVVNPSDMSDERIVVSPESRLYAELVDEYRERVAAVRAWSEGGDLPGRVCRKPSDARSHFCLHADTCFTDWEPEPLPTVDTPEARDLANAIYLLKIRERDAKGAVADVERERKNLQEQLAQLVDPGVWEVGNLTVRRTHVERAPSLNWKRAEAAGVLNVEQVAGFMKPGASYDVWDVTPNGTELEPSPDDFGPVPF